MLPFLRKRIVDGGQNLSVTTSQLKRNNPSTQAHEGDGIVGASGFRLAFGAHFEIGEGPLALFKPSGHRLRLKVFFLSTSTTRSLQTPRRTLHALSEHLIRLIKPDTLT